jgi:uncharacterized protein
LAVYFFDSSALVKRYAMEVGTSWVKTITDPVATNSIYIAEVTLVEVVAAITKRLRMRNITTTDAGTAILQFRYDFDNQYLIIGMTSKMIIDASALPETYQLRAYDAIQLATALEVNTQNHAIGLPALTLVSADNDLNAAAYAEGIVIENPVNHP